MERAEGWRPGASVRRDGTGSPGSRLAVSPLVGFYYRRVFPGEAMHELSIAMRVIDLAVGHLQAAGGGRVATVRLRVGRLAGVVPESLQAALVMAAQGTPLEAAAVEVEQVPVRIWCPACEREVELPGLVPLACPVCGARSGDVRAGNELELTSLVLAAEVEDAA